MVSWAVVFLVVLFEMGLSNKQNPILHVAAGGLTLDVAVDNNSLLFRAYLDANHITLAGLQHLEGLASDVDSLGALVGWVHLLNASVAIRIPVIELGSSQFSLAASAADHSGVHGEAPSDCAPVCSGGA